MANSIGHAALPYPIKGCKFTLEIPTRDSTGTLTDPTTPDTEVSIDDGAFADCTNEMVAVSGGVGQSTITLTGDELNGSLVKVQGKSANCLTTPVTLYPRVLAQVGTGTLSVGSAGGGTLGTLLAYDVTGCFIQTTGGAGGAGGSGSLNNQVRRIVTYNTGTGAFTVTPNWETTPDNTTTYAVLLPEGISLGMLRSIAQTGDSYTRLGAPAGASIAADIAAVFARLGSPAGASIAADIAAILTAVNNLNNLSALENIFGPPVMEIPDSSSTLYPFIVTFRDEEGHLIDVDTNAVTITATNAAGTDRSANLSAVTHEATGRYTFTYSVSSAAAEEGLRVNASATVGSSARYAVYVGAVANYDSVTMLAAIKTKTDQLDFDGIGNVSANTRKIFDSQLAAQLLMGNLTQSGADCLILVKSVASPVTLTSAYDSAKTAASQTSVDTANSTLTTLINRIGAWTGTGVNTLLGAFKALFGKDATAPSDIGGTFDPATDSVEAIRDEGDAAWGGGGGGTVSLGAHAPAGWINAAAIADAALDGKGDWATAADLVGATFTIRSPVLNASTIKLVPGADYYLADGMQLPYTWSTDVSGGTLTLTAGSLTVTATLLTGTTGYFEIPAAKSALLAARSRVPFNIVATLADGHMVAVGEGTVITADFKVGA